MAIVLKTQIYTILMQDVNGKWMLDAGCWMLDA
jgi:hypothetical protein